METKLELKLDKMDEKLDQIAINTALLQHRVTKLEMEAEDAKKESVANKRFLFSTFITATISLLIAAFKHVSGGQ